jgi:hypothetical protein
VNSTVFINGTAVGSLSAVDIDQPWFFGRFMPAPGFAHYRDLFTRLHHAWIEKRWVEVDQLSRQAEELDVQIVEPDGSIRYATRQAAAAMARIACVGFGKHGGAEVMSWRPA